MAVLSPSAGRLPLVDAARGSAILAMVVYHACWDLNFLGLVRFDLFGNPLWLAARTTILGSFLLLVGLSLVLATEHGLNWKRFLRRLVLLMAAAGAVSAASYYAFPESPIFFGVLHHIAVASLLGLAFVRLPWAVTLAAGAAVILIGETVSAPLFDQPWLRWIGLMTFEPDSNDYVPLFPWFGCVLLGIAGGRLWRRREMHSHRPRGSSGRLLGWAGRHSLAIYLLHQPLLLGSLWLVAQAVDLPPPELRSFLESCTASCVQTGARPNECAARCRCVSESLIEQGLWERALADRLRPDERQQVDMIVQRCE